MGLLQRFKDLSGWDSRPEQESAAPPDERRRHRRLQSSKLTVFIGGKRYKTNDWSLGGFRVTVPGTTLVTNDVISGPLHGPGLFDRGAYEACVVWVADSGEIGVRFIELSHGSFMAMSAAQV